jgi:hypothetical protein
LQARESKSEKAKSQGRKQEKVELSAPAPTQQMMAELFQTTEAIASLNLP